MSIIQVVDYDPSWPGQFESLRAALADHLGELVVSIEHVGSTSVSGLAAKPIIDLDIVVAVDDVNASIRKLSELGYSHSGDLGVVGREALQNPSDDVHGFAYHLYLCPENSLGLRNHLFVRDRLRSDPSLVERYGALKKRLAAEFPEDIDAYIAGKTDFLLSILRQSDLGESDLASIEETNDPGEKENRDPQP